MPSCAVAGGFNQFSLDCQSLCVSPPKSPSTTMQSPPAAPVTITPTVLQPSEHGTRYSTSCSTPRTPRTPLLRRGPALSLPNLQCLNAQLPDSTSTSTPLMPPPSVPSGPSYECSAPVCLLPHLYLGSNYHASRLSALEEHGITAVLNVSRCCPNYFSSRFSYMQIPVDDNTDADLLPWFEEASKFIDSIKRAHGRVLVHCQAGISRSATVCLAYLMKVRQIRLEEAFEFVRSMRTVISPNLAFMLQLLRFEAELLNSRKGDNATTTNSSSNANISNCEQNTNNVVSSPVKCSSAGVSAASRQLGLSNSPLLAKRMARSVSLPCPHSHASSPTLTPPRKQSLAFNFNFPVMPKTAAQSCALECSELSPGLSPIYSPL